MRACAREDLRDERRNSILGTSIFVVVVLMLASLFTKAMPAMILPQILGGQIGSGFPDQPLHVQVMQHLML